MTLDQELNWKCPNCLNIRTSNRQVHCRCSGKMVKSIPVDDQQNPIDSNKIWPPHLQCIFLGELLGKLNCNCNTTHPVYECKIHQSCTKRHTVYTWTDFEGNISPPPKGCSLCQEKQFGPDKPA